MHRFYLPNATAGPEFSLTGREAHHALHVLRIRRGEEIIVLNGSGGRFTCAVEAMEKDRLSLKVLAAETLAPLPCQLTLLQAVPRGKTMEMIVQKATELGAARIVPLLSERAVVQLDSEDAPAKVARWQQAAIEAIKQCGSPWLPVIDMPVRPAQFLAAREVFDVAVVGSLGRNPRHPRQVVEEYRSRHGKNPASVAIWIGPEGDFAPAELEMIQAGGAQPITLGPLVLRADTAAIYTLAVLGYETSWPGAPVPAGRGEHL